MQISKQAAKEYLIVRTPLLCAALAALIATLHFQRSILSLLIFFFGVWDGVNLGRYLEDKLTNNSVIKISQ